MVNGEREEVPAGYLLWKKVQLTKQQLCPAGELACGRKVKKVVYIPFLEQAATSGIGVVKEREKSEHCRAGATSSTVCHRTQQWHSTIVKYSF